MTIKSILYVFAGLEKELYALNTAFAIAKAHTARLRILHITPELTLGTEGIISNPEIVAAVEEDNAQRLKRAREYSLHHAALHNVPLDTEDTPARHASARFVHRVGEIKDIMMKEGRMCDLIIASHSLHDPNTLYDSVIVTSLFNTGRPLLLVPRLQGVMPTEWHNKVISFAWNGTLEAARALYNSVAFFEHAEKVHILVAREHDKKHFVTDEKSVIEYLSAHGVSSDVTVIDRADRTAAASLLIKAEMLKSDLLVMGGYGHSRFEEIILGGVTHFMLENSHIPLLLSH